MDGRVSYYYGGGHCCPLVTLVKSLGLWSHFALGLAAAHNRRDVLAHAFGLLNEICEEPEPARLSPSPSRKRVVRPCTWERKR
jgi:hypothetical protein